MSRLLVIPDIHNAIGWAEAILRRFEAEVDRTIFLGDYFDTWDDTAREASASASWLRAGLDSPNRVYLFGNHDMSYYSPGPATLCSGWTEEKNAAIAAIMRPEGGPDRWRDLKCFHLEEGWLFTHAGLRRDLLRPPEARPGAEAMEAMFARALGNIRRHRPDPVFGAGEYRLGAFPAGGATWLDFNEAWNRRDRLLEYHQVVGHSVLPVPRSIFGRNGDFSVVALEAPIRTRVPARLSLSCIEAKGRAFAFVDTAQQCLTVCHCQEGAPLSVSHETAITFEAE